MTISEIDPHVHSKYSYDSLLKPEKIVKNFIIITGAEIRTEIGDITGLFLNEEIKAHILLVRKHHYTFEERAGC